MYQVITENGYIVSVVSGVTNGNISAEEYNAIINMYKNKPIADEGFEYRLRSDTLEWELCELPPTDTDDGEEEISGDELKAMLEAIL